MSYPISMPNTLTINDSSVFIQIPKEYNTELLDSIANFFEQYHDLIALVKRHKGISILQVCNVSSLSQVEEILDKAITISYAK